MSEAHTAERPPGMEDETTPCAHCGYLLLPSAPPDPYFGDSDGRCVHCGGTLCGQCEGDQIMEDEPCPRPRDELAGVTVESEGGS